MRAGLDIHGHVVNNAVVEYICDTVIRALLSRALGSATFFVYATGRTALTERDMYIGCIDAAHECTLEGAFEDDASEAYADDADEESDDGCCSDDDSEGQFTSAIRVGLNPDEVRRASLMKRRAYEWHAFRPENEIQRAFVTAIYSIKICMPSTQSDNGPSG